MTIAIDLGNTRAKIGLFKDKELLEYVQDIPPAKVADWVLSRKPAAAIIASVNAPVQEIQQQVSKICPCLVLDSALAVPVKKQYKTPQSLGADRLAAAVGGQSLYPSQTVLVIDAGTCITYDLVDAKGNYLGGAISPGLQMRFKALHTFTARLPLLDHLSSPAPLLGQSTDESIASGVVNGTGSEIEGMISNFEAEFGSLRTIICGGDAKFFESKIKQYIFVIPELVLIGLNEILLYNASKT